MKSKRFRFHFSKDTNKKTCWTCWLLFQSSLGLGEVCAWIKNGAILTIEDTDTCTVEPHFKDTRLLWTVFFVPGESPYIFFQFNLLNTDTRWSGQYALFSFPIMNTFSYNYSQPSLMRTLYWLSTVCCDKPFFFEVKKNLQLTQCRCSQCSTPNRMTIFDITRVVQRTVFVYVMYKEQILSRDGWVF